MYPTSSYVRSCLTLAWLLLTSDSVLAQSVFPSNSTQDLYPFSSSARFLLNGTEFSNLPAIRLAPLGEYAQISHPAFLQISLPGHLFNVDASNANTIGDYNQFSYVSCDPSAYTGNLDASDVFRIVVNSPGANIVILYSETSDHCGATSLDTLPTISGILTTTDTMAATSLANLNLGKNSPGTCTILPDLNSFTNSTNGHGWTNNGGPLGQTPQPTTAVAMIILYCVTGLITVLFVTIIVTGAIRAHRHPERYGPRNIVGRGRQSRAKGIARAMLETLPIVKFGDHEDLQKKPPGTGDIEMNNADPNTNSSATDKSIAAKGASSTPEVESSSRDADGPVAAASNADGRDDEGQLGCSICTEDFTRGEEVRVLPCNHKFHPDCVDPWLLNVSGTCPLCRIDLRPQGEEGEAETTESQPPGSLPPPLGDSGTAAAPVGSNVNNTSTSGRRDTIAGLRNIAYGTREERIAALRRLRLERRPSTAGPGGSLRATEDERRGLSRRFRERFRIRTERRGTVSTASPAATAVQTTQTPPPPTTSSA